jgi:hypothetical protein
MIVGSVLGVYCVSVSSRYIPNQGMSGSSCHLLPVLFKLACRSSLSLKNLFILWPKIPSYTAGAGTCCSDGPLTRQH